MTSLDVVRDLYVFCLLEENLCFLFWFRRRIALFLQVLENASFNLDIETVLLLFYFE